LAGSVHLSLYAMLIAQVVLGFLYRWAQGEEFTFFGLFAVPAPFAPDRAWSRTFNTLHYDLAWIIIALAAGHALAALLYHYVMHDRNIRRMMP
jgi:cytochrome b561